MASFDPYVIELFKGLSNITILQDLFYNQILVSFIIIISSLIIAKIFLFFTEKVIERLTRKTKTKIDDYIVEKTKNPFYLLLIIFGLRIALIPLTISDNIELILMNLCYSIMIVIIFVIIGRSINVVIDEWGKGFAKKTNSSIDEQLLSLFHRFINIVLVIITVLVILNYWGYKITPILASLGIMGMAIGLALQSTLGNVFGGIQMIIDKSMKVGETVKIGTDIFGTVEDIGIRSTKIRTPDNELLIVPNGPLSNMTIQNWAQHDSKIRITVDFGVDYSSDPKKIKKILEDELKKIKLVLKDPAPSIFFMDMGDFALRFKAIIWIESFKDRFNVKSEAVGVIYDTLKNNNIVIPYPTQNVIMKKD